MNAGVVEEAEQQLESIEGPGRRLQQARLSRNLELSRVAAQLHLSVQAITALERDDYSKLPDAVFVRGYITNYARLLGLPAEQLTAAYNARLPGGGGAVRELGRVRMKDAIGGNHKPARVLSLLLMIGMGVVVAFWAKSRLDAPETTVPETSDLSLEQGQSVAPVARLPNDLDALPASDVSDEQPSGSVPGQSKPESLKLVTAAQAEEIPEAGRGPSKPERQQPPAPADRPSGAPREPMSTSELASMEPESPEAAQTAAQPEVILELVGPCWVDIRDANGDNKIIGEFAKGVQKVIRGEPPFSVVLGNSRAVRLLVNGELYDVARHAQGNVARFKLDPRKQDG